MPAKKVWTEAELTMLREGSADGLVLKELAAKLGLGLNTVARKLDDLSLPRRGNGKLVMRLRTASAETPFKRSKISLPRIATLERPPPWEREGYSGPPKSDDDLELAS
jgi:hypothetical protein